MLICLSVHTAWSSRASPGGSSHATISCWPAMPPMPPHRSHRGFGLWYVSIGSVSGERAKLTRIDHGQNYHYMGGKDTKLKDVVAEQVAAA